MKIDSALLGTVEDALKDAGIPFRGDALDPTGVKVRFSDPDTQLKAKDVLQAKLGDNYIVALNLISSSPQWLTAIGALPMYLGLDLRGGVHFLLQVDMKAALDKAADRYTTDIRSLLRERSVPGVARRNERRRPLPRRRRTHPGAGEIEKRSPISPCARRGAPGGSCLLGTLKPRREAHQDGAVQQNITILRNRVNSSASPSRSSSSREPTAWWCSPGVQDTRAKTFSAAPRRWRSAWSTTRPAHSEAALAGTPPLGSDICGTLRWTLPSGVGGVTGDRINDASPVRSAQQRTRRARSLDGTGAGSSRK